MQEIEEMVDARLARVERAFTEVKAAVTATLLRPEDLAPNVDIASAQKTMDDAMALYVKFELPKIFVFLANFGAAKQRASAVNQQ